MFPSRDFFAVRVGFEPTMSNHVGLGTIPHYTPDCLQDPLPALDLYFVLLSVFVACRGFEPPRRRYERPMQPITPSRDM